MACLEELSRDKNKWWKEGKWEKKFNHMTRQEESHDYDDEKKGEKCSIATYPKGKEKKSSGLVRREEY